MLPSPPSARTPRGRSIDSVHGLAALFLAVVLAACGGGGSTEAPPRPAGPPLSSLVITPANEWVQVAGTVSFRATGFYSDASVVDVSASVAWASANPDVAIVSDSPGSKGRAVGVAPGQAKVLAVLAGRTAEASLTVVSTPLPSLASIEVLPAEATISQGETARFTATGRYADASVRDLTTSADWSSSAATVATVVAAGPSAGVVTGVGRGQATIQASSQGRAGAAVVTVRHRLVSIAIAPATAVIDHGGTQAFTATGTWDDGATADVTALAEWSSSATTVATVSAGTASGLSPGTTTIRATVGALRGDAALTVVRRLVSVAIAPPAPSVDPGTIQTFTATATYSDAAAADVSASAAWASSATTVATMAGPVATAIAPGATRITAVFGGLSGEATLTVVRRLRSIAVSPAVATIDHGATRAYTATGTYGDGTTGDLTAAAEWTSGAPTVATMSGATATAVWPGTTTLSATYAGVSGVATLVVVPRLVAVEVTPASATLEVASTLALAARGSFSDLVVRDVSASAAWASSATTIMTLSGPVALGRAPGAATARAAVGAVVGEAALTISARAISCQGGGAGCADGSRCCSTVCASGACTTAQFCVAEGGACGSSAQCCGLACVEGACAAGACASTGAPCQVPSQCCTGLCEAGSCAAVAPLGPACVTLGNGCAVAGDCCSTACQGGVCVPAFSCGAEDDLCYRDQDCCSFACSTGTTNAALQPGRCIGHAGGALASGNPCRSSISCASRRCGDPGSGVGVCLLSSGCRVPGLGDSPSMADSCDTNASCCGGTNADYGGGSTTYDVVCAKPDASSPPLCLDRSLYAAPGDPSMPPGKIAGGLPSWWGPQCSYLDEAWVPRGGTLGKHTGKADSQGILRCFGGPVTTACPNGWDALRPGCCIPAGQVCQFGDQCCNGEPCVPDVVGVLRCAKTVPPGGSGACVPRGAACAASGECCAGLGCEAIPGTSKHECLAAAPAPSCLDTGRSCSGDASCCTGYCFDGAVCGGCVPDAGVCGTDADCCSASCSAGVCTGVFRSPPCVPGSGNCTADVDCCGGVCAKGPGATSGTCAPTPVCAAVGDACDDAMPCCGGTCLTPELAPCSGLVSGCTCGE